MKISKETFEQFWKDEQELICSYIGEGGILEDSGAVSFSKWKPINPEFVTMHVCLDFDLIMNLDTMNQILNEKINGTGTAIHY